MKEILKYFILLVPRGIKERLRIMNTFEDFVKCVGVMGVFLAPLGVIFMFSYIYYLINLSNLLNFGNFLAMFY